MCTDSRRTLDPKEEEEKEEGRFVFFYSILHSFPPRPNLPIPFATPRLSLPFTLPPPPNLSPTPTPTADKYYINSACVQAGPAASATATATGDGNITPPKVIVRGMMAKAGKAPAGGGGKKGDAAGGGGDVKGDYGLGVVPINYLKDGKDVPIKPDEEYPDWLWNMQVCFFGGSGLGGVLGLVWFGLVWFGLVWFGLVWFGLVWLGFGFGGLIRLFFCFFFRFVSVRFDSFLSSWFFRCRFRSVGARCGSVRFGSVRFGSVRFGSVRFGSVRFD